MRSSTTISTRACIPPSQWKRSTAPHSETFLSQPTTLTDHLHWQLSLSLASEIVSDTVEAIIGNLDEDGYLTTPLEEVAAAAGASEQQAEEALRLVQEFDPRVSLRAVSASA